MPCCVLDEARWIQNSTYFARSRATPRFRDVAYPKYGPRNGPGNRYNSVSNLERHHLIYFYLKSKQSLVIGALISLEMCTFRWYFSLVFFAHVSCLMAHISSLMSYGTYFMSHVLWHMFHVSCWRSVIKTVIFDTIAPKELRFKNH